MAGNAGRLAHIVTIKHNRLRAALYGSLQRAAYAGEISSDGLEDRASLLMAAVMGLNIAARGGATDRELKCMLSGVCVQLRNWDAP